MIGKWIFFRFNGSKIAASDMGDFVLSNGKPVTVVQKITTHPLNTKTIKTFNIATLLAVILGDAIYNDTLFVKGCVLHCTYIYNNIGGCVSYW